MPKKTAPTDPQKAFTRLLLNWNSRQNRRQMPWKAVKDPYKVWLSEIILQQTRVEQGLSYYERFLQHFPRITDLASAPDEQIMKLWEGLGYYSRCRNLMATARYIAFENDGQFPDNYDAIRSLKGVGPYTAAAIASFAFDLPHAVVDGNVYRVLARVFGIDTPIDSTEGKKQFHALAEQLIARDQPAAYNQAIMDFGATVCKPAAPLCDQCAMQDICKAKASGTWNQLPVKTKKLSMRTRYFSYLLIQYRDRIFIRQRMQKDIWQHLYELVLLEEDQDGQARSAIDFLEKEWGLTKKDFKLVAETDCLQQQLSHQRIRARFFAFQLSKKPRNTGEGIWIAREELSRYAFPRLIRDYLAESV
jgi:A/G-specific adenine glycosylase